MELKLFPYVLLIVIIQLLSSNSDLQRRLIQAREQSRYSAILSVAFSLVNIGVAVLFVAGFRWGAVGMLLAQALCGAVFFLQALHYLWPDLRGTFRREMLRSSAIYGLGILPSHLLANASPLLTRTILTQVDSMAAVGLLGLATRMANPLSVLVTAFNSAYLPLYFSIRKEETESGLEKLALTARHVWVLALGCFLAVALLGPPAIVLMTPDRYHDAASLVPVLAIGFLAQTLYTLLGPEIFYSKRTWLVPIVSAAGLCTSLALATVLAPLFGAMGVAWATTAGLIAATLTATYFSLQTVRVPHEWAGLARSAVVAAIVFALATWANHGSTTLQWSVGVVALFVFPLALLAVGDRTAGEARQYFRRAIRP
jgi:O-antigen/teichoic acid export membrane protein